MPAIAQDGLFGHRWVIVVSRVVAIATDNDLEGAAAELIIVVNLEPHDTGSRVVLAELLERLGRSDEAKRYR